MIAFHLDSHNLQLTEEDEADIALRVQQPFQTKELPNQEWVALLPLHQAILFPGIILPITIHTKSLAKIIRKASQENQPLAVVATKKPNQQNTLQDLHPTGTLVRIIKLIALPNNQHTVILQGINRITLDDIKHTTTATQVHIERLTDDTLSNTKKAIALIQTIKSNAQEILDYLPSSQEDTKQTIANIQDPNLLTYYLATYLKLSFVQKQTLLNTHTTLSRSKTLLKYLLQTLHFIKEKKKLESDFYDNIHDKHRHYWIKEQIDFLQKEIADSGTDELETLAKAGSKKRWPPLVAKHFAKTLTKLQNTHPHNPDYSTNYHYAETILDLPWEHYSKDNKNFKKVATTLERGHYGMEKVKERILEFLATHQHAPHPPTNSILCLWGPPGTGKTSIARNIAKALHRKFASMALGGIYDVSKLTGHRTTYVGAMPGDIITMLKRAGTANPVILLDEIEKTDNHRGKVEAALLEILDPEQNKEFTDTYLGVPFDLSKVLFITTANDPTCLSKPLKDRMELIEVPGYPCEEKITIAQKYILPKKRRQHGLKASELALTTTTLQYLIDGYTSESGIRELTRKIEHLCRKAILASAQQKPHPPKPTPQEITTLLGPPPYDQDRYEPTDLPGIATGLAWTSVGGTILSIESTLYPGEGKLILSGQLGDVMEESALTAHSYLKAHADILHIPSPLFRNYDLHIHLPDGATPKDGPSAGITLLTALTSVYTQRSVKKHIAMTGEITLRGNILPVGGIQEKVLAAKRAGCHTIYMSKQNKKDVQKLKPQYLQGLTFHYLSHVEELLPIVLHDKPYKHARKWDLTISKNKNKS